MYTLSILSAQIVLCCTRHDVIGDNSISLVILFFNSMAQHLVVRGVFVQHLRCRVPTAPTVPTKHVSTRPRL